MDRKENSIRIMRDGRAREVKRLALSPGGGSRDEKPVLCLLAEYFLITPPVPKDGDVSLGRAA